MPAAPDSRDRFERLADRALARVRSVTVGAVALGALAAGAAPSAAQEAAPEPARAETAVPADTTAAESKRATLARLQRIMADDSARVAAREDTAWVIDLGEREARFEEMAPGDLVIEPEILDHLKTVMAGRESETLFCLAGELGPEGKVHVDGLYEPNVAARWEKRVLHFGCLEDAVGDVHNHPAHMQADDELRRALKRTTGAAPEKAADLCYLSPGDKMSALYERGERVGDDAESVKVVMVGDRVRCWWTLDQIREREWDGVIQAIGEQLVVDRGAPEVVARSSLDRGGR